MTSILILSFHLSAGSNILVKVSNYGEHARRKYIMMITSIVAARMGEVRGPYNILVGRPEGIRPLGRPRRRWEDNIKMDLREIGFGDVDWIRWAQDKDRWRALVNTVMNLRVP
jgi:hypothetical protein